MKRIADACPGFSYASQTKIQTGATSPEKENDYE